ncbi:MAG: F0F1 ATP synthase subunit epsilon [Rubrivivax sp.]|jgi:F-type H+-transporting ATPase subunit epsilon|nr:F0F1 ATP synthase subunit epsilon [Rubrivivax sp.]MBK7260575.1 F0F1 ATP synthase subunit epsilon [Rubrivivax sp.]MBK8526251.1 F0F1 ATP synthase subunit epsilon [Rubrivivax sp.]
MKLDILLPAQRLLRRTDVLRIVAETADGSFGLLPRRRDCVAALAPGIFSFETAADGEVFVAVDDGVLIKAGADVVVSVRRAMIGADLGTLRAAVEREFRAEDELARQLREAMDKLEIAFLTRLGALRHG